MEVTANRMSFQLHGTPEGCKFSVTLFGTPQEYMRKVDFNEYVATTLKQMDSNFIKTESFPGGAHFTPTNTDAWTFFKNGQWVEMRDQFLEHCVETLTAIDQFVEAEPTEPEDI